MRKLMVCQGDMTANERFDVKHLEQCNWLQLFSQDKDT